MKTEKIKPLIFVFKARKERISIKKVKNFIILVSEGMKLSLSFIGINFINSKKMIEINKKYLNHDYDTDIITFSYEESGPYKAEIFISLNQAKLNAEKYKNDLNCEIIRLLIHGLLHIIGYTDNEKNAKRKMKQIENEMVEKYLSQGVNLFL